MKKLLIVLAIILAFTVIFVACKNDEPETPTTGDPETSETESTTPNEDNTGDLPIDGTSSSTDEGNSSEQNSSSSTDDGGSSEENTSSSTTEEPPVENDIQTATDIHYAGSITTINGLGQDGKKFSMSNGYHTVAPHTNNPNASYYPPLANGMFDYYCRRISVTGWAILEGGQGDFVWSDDMGATWKPVTSQKLMATPDGQDLTPFCQSNIGDIKNLDNSNAYMSEVLIDLSSYDDDEYVTVWIGRLTTDGKKAVPIFKIEPVCIGDEVYVADRDAFDHVTMEDARNPVYIVSFDSMESQASIQDANGQIDRLRVWWRNNSYWESIGNNTIGYTWNKYVRLLEKDIAVSNHVFTIQGWVGFNNEYGKGLSETNVTFEGCVYRNGEPLKAVGGGGYNVSVNPGVVGVLSQAGLPGGAVYKYWLGVSDLQDGDVVHLYMIDNATGEKYCLKDFTIKVVADSTDLSQGPFIGEIG